MAYREFRDQHDVLWYVWEIQPSTIERRLHDDETKRPAIERRRAPSAPRFRPSNPQLMAGWLAFESSLGKRRLYPVPTQWEILSDDELTALLAQAIPAEKRYPIK
jgi:hypothetical protein